MTLKFNTIRAVVKVGPTCSIVRAKYHQAECSGSWVIVLTEKITPAKTILSVATADSGNICTNVLFHTWPRPIVHVFMTLKYQNMMTCLVRPSISVSVCLSVSPSVRKYTAPNSKTTRARLSLGLADRTHGAHSQPASITVRVRCFEHVVAYARNLNVVTCLFT